MLAMMLNRIDLHRCGAFLQTHATGLGLVHPAIVAFQADAQEECGSKENYQEGEVDGPGY